MIRPRMTDWRPERDLASLLDALTEELLATTDRELAFISQEGDQADAVRRIIAAAESDICPPHGSEFLGPGLRAFVSRNQ